MPNEREIEAVLRAVLDQRHGAFRKTLGAYVGVNLSDDDLAAMARAVEEQVVEPLVSVMLSDRNARLTMTLADRDARIARLVEALANLLDAAVAYDLMASNQPDEQERKIVSDFHRAKALARAALADAGAGK